MAYGAIGTRGEIRYPRGSEIMGVPQGEHQVRSYTSNLVVFDEAAFQNLFRDSFYGALPMAKRVIVISTVLGGSWFCDLAEIQRDSDEYMTRVAV
jgi:hypothetical protein